MRVALAFNALMLYLMLQIQTVMVSSRELKCVTRFGVFSFGNMNQNPVSSQSFLCQINAFVPNIAFPLPQPTPRKQKTLRLSDDFRG